MSWSRRHLLLALSAATGLAACGFTPVYGPGGGGTALRDRIAVIAPDTTEGFRLQARIEDRLGRGTDLRLTVTLAIDEEGVATSPTQQITRFQINGAATYSLIDPATGGALASGTVETFTSFSSTGTPAATLSAERDARDRLAVALADLVVTRLLATTP